MNNEAPIAIGGRMHYSCHSCNSWLISLALTLSLTLNLESHYSLTNNSNSSRRRNTTFIQDHIKVNSCG
jgi:hypothetical protein